MTRITLAPVTRIEGHAKVTIDLDDSGNVADTFVNVVELRGFEKFCIGRPVEELPRIMTGQGERRRVRSDAAQRGEEAPRAVQLCRLH
jgi:hypothetical protein